ncbi:hypothetical protein Tasa_009_123 [Tanticharoenia sakaeratensis NBRC 103193]|uniref:Uncharacterized protein n=1 Tax=Tanticharoenia sakaeratensis NBRC 103193 TaxID=1231623 RepID=A0A0D6MJ90_9PROT|nr:hypothetical protein Tasa_009_123 [Tanticharoenia sakaeratensis NBRC 103193]
MGVGVVDELRCFGNGGRFNRLELTFKTQLLDKQGAEGFVIIDD